MEARIWVRFDRISFVTTFSPLQRSLTEWILSLFVETYGFRVLAECRIDKSNKNVENRDVTETKKIWFSARNQAFFARTTN